MNCPIDSAQLAISERQGVEIDYCPTCRGVWLDRGELDKIIEKNESAAPAPQQPPRQDRYEHDGYRNNDQHKPRKKESFLGDLFDF